jgi:hypothetical protein
VRFGLYVSQKFPYVLVKLCVNSLTAVFCNFVKLITMVEEMLEAIKNRKLSNKIKSMHVSKRYLIILVFVI